MSSSADLVEQLQPVEGFAGQRPSVLIIDDDDTLAEVLSHRLERQGFDTRTAGRGLAGLEKARSERPALVILDLHLPDVDGLSVCAQLADSHDTCMIPVIILSGTDRPDMLRQCRAAGCHYFLRKPYDPNALLTLIRHAIREVACGNDGDGDGWDG